MSYVVGSIPGALLVDLGSYLDRHLHAVKTATAVIVRVARREVDGVTTVTHAEDVAGSIFAHNHHAASDIASLVDEGEIETAEALAREYILEIAADDPAIVLDSPTKAELRRLRGLVDGASVGGKDDFRFYEIDLVGREEGRRERYRLMHRLREKGDK